jgi:thiol-disulfide isomerase/thioredoxin
MSWKLVLVSLVVLAIIVLVVLYSMGVSLGFDIQGFQNLSGPAPAMNTFTMYYADWCPHCQSVKPEFNEFSNRGSIEVGGKKCQIMMVDAAKNPDATKGKPVKGFPTFLLETTDGKILEYQGERNTEGWLSFINEKMGGGV